MYLAFSKLRAFRIAYNHIVDSGSNPAKVDVDQRVRPDDIELPVINLGSFGIVDNDPAGGGSSSVVEIRNSECSVVRCREDEQPAAGRCCQRHNL